MEKLGIATIDRPDRIRFVTRRSPTDRVFRGVVMVAGNVTLVVMVLIGTFLLVRSWTALRVAGWSFLTETRWVPEGGHFGIAAVMLGTMLIAVVALVLAVPVAIGTALFITEYAPDRLARALTSLVDLLAAIPALLYGIWGAQVLQPRVLPVSRWFSTHMAWFPPFHTSKNGGFANSTFLAGIVVSLMVLPICIAIMREVFSQAPPGEKEGALALGATRWGVIRTVVLPFGKGGIVGGSMLGLGRALGETIAIALIISPTTSVTNLSHILQTGGNSIGSLIALRFSEANAFGISALMAAGLALFGVTLVVNAVGSLVVNRSRAGSATEI
jgi:phosphate transport system permease protein